jgi:hypothetical protein
VFLAGMINKIHWLDMAMDDFHSSSKIFTNPSNLIKYFVMTIGGKGREGSRSTKLKMFP